MRSPGQIYDHVPIRAQTKLMTSQTIQNARPSTNRLLTIHLRMVAGMTM